MKNSKAAIAAVATILISTLSLKSYGDQTIQIHGASCNKLTNSYSNHYPDQEVTWDNPEYFDSSVVVERSDVGAFNASTTHGTVLECRGLIRDYPYHSDPGVQTRVRAFLQGRHMAPVVQKLQTDFSVVYAFGPPGSTNPIFLTNFLPAAGQHGERFTIASGWFPPPPSGGIAYHMRFRVSLPPQTMLYTIYVKTEAVQ